MNSLQLLSSKKEFFLFFVFLVSIFLFNLGYEYSKYKDLTYEEVFSSNFQIVNIYEKDKVYVLKVKNSDFSFFTSVDKNQSFKKLEQVHLAILTTKIDFISYLKGFYAKTFYYEKLQTQNSFKKHISTLISKQHTNVKVQELFNALFLAIPLSKENREIYTNFGISHLIAISGFHLGIIVAIVYALFYFPYSYFHQRYFPYRNRRFDIFLFTFIILAFYLILTDLVPSLLRAFIMFLLGVFYLRRNIKVLSFQTLLITLLLILALFPKYIFSISLWFSIIGVFYIFLYIQYFKTLPKWFSFLFFNFWIFLVFNPIVHFYFYNSSYEQLLSVFLTLGFTLFYPIELFLHIVGFSNIFDSYILLFLDYKMTIFEIKTPFWFFILYLLTSLMAIFKKAAFIFLNILLVIFNFYLHMAIFCSKQL